MSLVPSWEQSAAATPLGVFWEYLYACTDTHTYIEPPPPHTLTYTVPWAKLTARDKKKRKSIQGHSLRENQGLLGSTEHSLQEEVRPTWGPPPSLSNQAPRFPGTKTKTKTRLGSCLFKPRVTEGGVFSSPARASGDVDLPESRGVHNLQSLVAPGTSCFCLVTQEVIVA